MPDAPLSAAAATVRRNDPDRFLTALFAPADRRETLFVLYAFNHEIARAREVASEPTLALIRLQWWREVVEGTHRRHEIATPLAEAIDDGRLDRADLLEMLDGREAEAEASLPSRAAWVDYLDHTAGALAQAAGRVLGADDATRGRLRQIGIAYGVAGHLRSVTALASRERCLLPEDVLGAHGLTTQAVIAAPDAPALAAVCADLAEDGRARLAAAAGRFPKDAVAAALPGVLARRDFRRLHQPVRPRGLGDRLAVMAAAARARI